MRRVVLIGVLTLTGVLPLGAKDTGPLTLRVTPAVAFAPANLLVCATIEANASNRAVEIVAESESFYRSSQMQLDGDSAPRMASFELRSLPAGEYEVRAVLIGAAGEIRADVHRTATVVAPDGSH